MFRLIALVLFAAVIPLSGCDHPEKNVSRPGVSRSVVVQPDTHVPFDLDATKPFVIQFGRGSGWDGLDTVRIDESGNVDLCRLEGRPIVESAHLQLSPPRMKEVVDLLNARKLTHLGRSYSDPNIADGTQWVLWIEQGSSQKAIYFNNAFPDEITGFADQLDTLLQRSGLQTATWTETPAEKAKKEQNELWDRIK